MEAARRRVLILVEEPSRLGQPAREALGVLESPPLRPKLLLLARAKARAVELRKLKPEQVFTLDSVALGRSRALRLGSSHPVLGEQIGHAVQ